jgi:hypothetical protein
MGISAFVYFNADKYSNHPLREYFSLDVDTGGLEPIENTGIPYDQIDLGEVEAINERIGNAAFCGLLRSELKGILNEDSLTLKKMLRLGDPVRFDELSAFENELKIIVNSRAYSEPVVQYYVEVAKRLIDIAKRERNPIITC